MVRPIITRRHAKARARSLRAHAPATEAISHADALERVAHELGYADWNTLSAQLRETLDAPLNVGDRVEGRYLDQPFHGVVVAMKALEDGRAFAVTIHFDAPLDVVVFDSFSAFRRRVRATVSPAGVSFAKTSNGVPHLVVAPTSAAVV